MSGARITLWVHDAVIQFAHEPMTVVSPRPSNKRSTTMLPGWEIVTGAVRGLSCRGEGFAQIFDKTSIGKNMGESPNPDCQKFNSEVRSWNF